MEIIRRVLFSLRLYLFWVFVIAFIVSDFNTSLVKEWSNEDYFFVIQEIIYVFVMYNILYYLIINNLPSNTEIVILVIFTAFLLTEYYQYYLFSYAAKKLPTSIFYFYKSKIGTLNWWDIPFNRKIIYFTSSIHFFYLTVPLFLRVIFDLNNSRFQLQKLKEENLKLELGFLRSQLNPHLLFNTLNNIYGLVVDNSKAAESITKLSGLMRYSLYHSGKETVSLHNELGFLKDYISLESLRLIEEKKLEFTIVGNADNLNIIPLLLITYVENALKHGLYKTKDASWVKINISIEDTILNFSCINKVSQSILKPQPIKEKDGGIGLKNAEYRLKVIYPKKHKLNIIHLPDKFEVNLKINLDKNARSL